MTTGSTSTGDSSSASDFSRGPLWLIVIAVLAMLMPRGGQPTDATKTASAEQGAKTLTASDTADGGTFVEQIQRMGAVQSYKPGRPAIATKYLVATVLDPVDSHLRSNFDADVAVIQRAIQQYGFTLRDYWLPWQDWLGKEPAKRELDAIGRRPYEKDPGILLFRRVAPDDHIEQLFVLLVGETPTGGVHREALIAALKQANKGSTEEIRILGPTTSGGCAPLRLALLSWAEHSNWKTTIRIITGSATSSSALEHLAARAPWLPDLKICVRATVWSDDAISAALVKHLTNTRRLKLSQVALLVEAGTEYGQGYRESGWNDALFVPYPMEIGTVRTAYDKVQTLKYGSEPQKPAPRTNLEIPWEQPSDTRDILPMLSGTTPVVTEQRLAQSLTSIARRDIRAIGLVGTNPMDLIFLAQQIRRYCPNVQLFALESNVIFTHPDCSKYFKGMIVASTYPLFLSNQDWTRRTGKRLTMQFSSGSSEGVFNATLAHMAALYPEDRGSGHAHPLREYGTPFSKSKESGQPSEKEECDVPVQPFSEKSRPPVWLTIVGQNRPAPIAAESIDDDLLYGESITNDETESTLDAPARPPLTDITIVLGVLVLVFVLPCAYRLIFGDAKWKRIWMLLFNIWPWIGVQRIPTRIPQLSRRTMWKWQHAYLLVMLASSFVFVFLFAFAASMAVGMPAGVYQYGPGSLSARLATGLTLLLIVVGTVRVFYLWFAGRKPLPHTLGENLLLFVAFTSTIVLAIVSGVYFYTGTHDNVLARANWLERNGDLFNGVSTIVPLAALAMVPFAWAVCHLRRHHLMTVFRLVQPFPQQGHPMDELYRRLADLEETIARPFWWPKEVGTWPLILFVLIGTGNLWFRWIPTADRGWQFDLALAALMAVALNLTCGLHFRFMEVSKNLELFLRRVAQTDLADSFKDVPPRLRAKTAAQIFTFAPELGDLDICVRQLDALARSAPPGMERLLRIAAAAKDRFKKVGNQQAHTTHGPQLGMPRINNLLFMACREICRRLYMSPAEYGDWYPRGKCREWENDARTFVATQLTILLRQVFTQIQNTLTFLTIMVLLFIWAAYSYPFQPQRYISMCVIFFVLWIVGWTAYVFLKFNRNEILSNLAESAPNRLSLDRSLIQQFVVYGAVPVLSLLAFQFPQIGDVLFFWVGGLQQAVR